MYYIEAIKKYAKFSGRANRKEYWYFFLFNLIFTIALGIADSSLKISSISGESMLGDIYSLFIFLPSLAVGVRRLHDTNRSGWFILIPIYNIILLAKKGDDALNKYGEISKK